MIAEYGRHRLLRDDWLQVFEPESVTDHSAAPVYPGFFPVIIGTVWSGHLGR